jgi:hypothetical protein
VTDLVSGDFPKIPPQLENAVIQADFQLKLWVESVFPRGSTLVWVKGRYVGRRCRVLNTRIINEPDGTLSVGIRVETRRLDNANYMSRGDIFHRTYYGPAVFARMPGLNPEVVPYDPCVG